MLLQRNAFLEGFIQDDLSAALVTASQALTQLAVEPPTKTHKEAIITLQNVINRLEEMARFLISPHA
jgi:hypothetical protein